MGALDMLRLPFAWGRLLVELKRTRLALERIATVQEEMLIFQTKQSGAFHAFTSRIDPDAEGGDVLEQTDEELARLERLEMQRGGPDVVPLDEDLDQMDGGEWIDG